MECGLEIKDMGHTYLADRLSEQGELIESALDHIYVSAEIEMKSTCCTLDESSTDHLPIMIKINRDKFLL